MLCILYSTLYSTLYYTLYSTLYSTLYYTVCSEPLLSTPHHLLSPKGCLESPVSGRVGLRRYQKMETRFMFIMLLGKRCAHLFIVMKYIQLIRLASFLGFWLKKFCLGRMTHTGGTPCNIYNIYLT